MEKKKMVSRKKKRNHKDLVIILIIGAACVIMLIITNIGSNKEKKPQENYIDAPTPIEEQKEVTPIAEVNTPTPSPTKEPSVTVTETPVETVSISIDEAIEHIRQYLEDAEVTITLRNEDKMLHDNSYFEFLLHKQGVDQEYFVLVHKLTGELYSVDELGIISGFEKPSFDFAESVITQGEVIEKDMAVLRLGELSKEVLLLSKNLSEYLLETDSWTTVVNHENCYCINVFEKQEGVKQLVGIYYVAENGKNVYRLNEELQEFTIISE